MTVASTPTDTTKQLGQLTLRVSVPGGPSRLANLASAHCRIGSSESCTLTLLAPGVRDVHCEIRREAHRSVVHCLSDETRLNGEEFAQSPLDVGDRLTLGPLEIEVVADERADTRDESDPDGDVLDEWPDLPVVEPERAAAELISEKQTGPLASTWREDASAEWQTRLADVESQLQDLAEALRQGPQDHDATDPRLDELEKSVEPLAHYQEQWDGTRQQVEAWVRRAERIEQGLAKSQEQDAAWREQLQDWQSERTAAEADMQQRLQELAGIVRESLADRVIRDESEDAACPEHVVAASEDESADDEPLASMPEVVDEADEPPLSADLSEDQQESVPAPTLADVPDVLSEDELTFEEVPEDAPVSAAALCQQFGAPAEAEEQPAPPLPTTPDPPAPADPCEEEEQGIEQYMASLLQRMQSGASSAAQSWTPTAPEDDEETAESFAPVHMPEDPIAEEDFVPRAQAPEASCDLTAMRALANTSARKAIDSHNRRSQAIATQGKLIVAGVALIFSFVLMWFSAAGSTVASWSALLSLTVAIYWAGRYLMLTRTEDTANSRKKRKKKKSPQPSATAPPEAPADATVPSASE